MSRTPLAHRLATSILIVVLAASACGSDDVAIDPGTTPSVPTVEVGGQPEPTPAPAATPEPEASVSEPSADPAEPTAVPTADPEPAPLASITNLSGLDVELVEIASAETPIVMALHPDGSSLLVGGRAGTVRRYEATGDGSYAPDDGVLVDLVSETSTTLEQGLLGLAVAPDGRHLYVVHSTADGANRLVELDIDGNAEREVLVVEQPFANHNGGGLAFGPDGFLYYSLGDGGGAGDPLLTGQDTSDLLGSLVRIEPTAAGEAPYRVPADNPFISDSGRDELFLYGARNPWRFSFDRATGDLWVADVGQSAVEEINWLPARDGGGIGANLGWSLREGSLAFGGDEPANHTPPVFEYARDVGCSVIGGYVYRGPEPTLHGAYIYGDYCTGEIFGLVIDESGTVLDNQRLATVPGSQLASFGEGHDGEIFAVLLGGSILRLDVGA
ncbi:MAG: PQQ-dependent sugar dehydrogenase [Acidimicrobiia bacterium]|nr:PQQ-dependent sugar dehydrogenase [Acidimicrobiia bacterium]